MPRASGTPNLCPCIWPLYLSLLMPASLLGTPFEVNQCLEISFCWSFEWFIFLISGFNRPFPNFWQWLRLQLVAKGVDKDFLYFSAWRVKTKQSSCSRSHQFGHDLTLSSVNAHECKGPFPNLGLGSGSSLGFVIHFGALHAFCTEVWYNHGGRNSMVQQTKEPGVGAQDGVWKKPQDNK